MKIAKPLLGWMYHETILKRGYIIDSNLPKWMTEDNRKVVLSRSKLWVAHYWKIRNSKDGTITPPPPLHMYKHGLAAIYNAGKPGVDQSTELSMSIVLNNAKLALEPKYILQMSNGIMGNSWFAHIAGFICKPYIEEGGRESGSVEMNKLRNKINNCKDSLQDHKFFTSIEILKGICRKQLYCQPVVVRRSMASVAATDTQIMSVIACLVVDKTLPVKRNRAQKFEDNQDLKRICLYKSNCILHDIECIPGNSTRATCSLCSDGNTGERTTRYRCGTCLLPLCTTPIPRGTMKNTCFKFWNTSNNLKLTQKIANGKLVTFRNKNCNSLKAISARKNAKASANIQRSNVFIPRFGNNPALHALADVAAELHAAVNDNNVRIESI